MALTYITMEIQTRIRTAKPVRPEGRRFKTVEELKTFKNDELNKVLKNLDLSLLKRLKDQ